MGIDCVDDVGFYALQLCGCERAAEEYHLGGGDERAVFSGQNLDALRGGVRPLVELAGEKLDGKSDFIFSKRKDERGGIHLRFRQDQGLRCKLFSRYKKSNKWRKEDTI